MTTEKDSKMDCKYTAEFPVDEWDRLGGLYSLADVPIAKYKKITREGTITARDRDTRLFEIQDEEKGFTIVVPMDDVKVDPTSAYAT
tara:strand:- start:119 stop:379 length:261 start_codon:yes stop_codon:yes gene_type:complete